MLFRERLTPPPLWWVIGAVVAATFPIAVLFYLGPVWALATAAAAIVLLLTVLAGWAAIRIELDDTAASRGTGPDRVALPVRCAGLWTPNGREPGAA